MRWRRVFARPAVRLPPSAAIPQKRSGKPFPFRKVFGLGGIGALLAFVVGYGVSTRVIFPAPPPPRGLVVIPDLRGLTEGASLTNPMGTARMEQILAEVAQQKCGPQKFLDQIKSFTQRFVQEIISMDQQNLPPELKQQTGTGSKFKKKYKSKKAAKPLDIPCPLCKKPLVERKYKSKKTNKFESFAGCSGYPDCKHTQPL